MTHQRCIELLNEIVSHISTAENTPTTIRKCLELGFTPEELESEFQFGRSDIKDVLEACEC